MSTKVRAELGAFLAVTALYQAFLMYSTADPNQLMQPVSWIPLAIGVTQRVAAAGASWFVSRKLVSGD